MKKILTFALIALFLFNGICLAKRESGSSDAASVVLYGYNGTTLTPVKVSSDGTLNTNASSLYLLLDQTTPQTTIGTFTFPILQTGKAGADGQLKIYSEQGTTDYMATLNPNATMTSNANFYLPADEPAGTYLLNMTTGGIIGYDSNTYLTSANFAKDLTTSAPLSGGADNILYGPDGDVDLSITMLKDLVAGTGLSGGADDVLPGADSDVTLSIDQSFTPTWTGAHIFEANATLGKNGATGQEGILTLRDGANPGATKTWSYTKLADLEAANGIVTCNGSGDYAAITDNHLHWDSAYSAMHTQGTDISVNSSLSGVLKATAGTLAACSNLADVVYLTAEVDGSTTNELPTEGTYTDVSGTQVSVDLTEAESVSWGAGAQATIAHTFNVSGTDVTVTYGSASVDYGAAVLATTSNIKSVPHQWHVAVTSPNAMYTAGSTIVPICTLTDAALTVTKIVVSTSSASYEVAGDLKYADARIGLANATVINDIDTSSGVRTDTSITSGAVASGKFVYLSLDSAPNASMTDFVVDVYWDYD